MAAPAAASQIVLPLEAEDYSAFAGGSQFVTGLAGRAVLEGTPFGPAGVGPLLLPPSLPLSNCRRRLRPRVSEEGGEPTSAFFALLLLGARALTAAMYVMGSGRTKNGVRPSLGKARWPCCCLRSEGGVGQTCVACSETG